jgi:hypothetical protein
MKKRFNLKNTETIYNFIDVEKELKLFNFRIEKKDEVYFSNDFNFISI